MQLKRTSAPICFGCAARLEGGKFKRSIHIREGACFICKQFKDVADSKTDFGIDPIQIPELNPIEKKKEDRQLV